MSIVGEISKEGTDTTNAAAFEDPNATLETAAEVVAETEQKVVGKGSGKNAAAKESKPAAETAPAAQSAATPSILPAGKPLGHLLSAGSNISPLRDLKGALEAQGVELVYNTFPRYRDDKGVIGDVDGNEAGGWVEVMVISWSDSWTCTPGDDSDKAKECLRYSKDGHTIHSDDDWNGKTCEEYVEYMRDQLGYEKASVKKYTNVYGMLVAADQADCAGLQQIIQLSLAPTSGAAWEAYMVNRAMRARMGMVQETTGNPVVRFTSHRVKNAKNTFYKLNPTEGTTEVNLAH